MNIGLGYWTMKHWTLDNEKLIIKKQTCNNEKPAYDNRNRNWTDI